MATNTATAVSHTRTGAGPAHQPPYLVPRAQGTANAINVLMTTTSDVGGLEQARSSLHGGSETALQRPEQPYQIVNVWR
jgi:hypothetical protein